MSKIVVDALILAAGTSSRMGQPKQLLTYGSQSFLARAFENAKKSQCRHTKVVLGAHFDQIIKKVKHLKKNIVFNPDWSNGMGSSIACGVDSMMDLDIPDGLLVLLVDQPKISFRDLDVLIGEFSANPNMIIASSVADSFGPPTIFPASMFHVLMNLNGDEGAKRIIKSNPDFQLKTIDFGDRTIDVDTPESYDTLMR